MSDKDNDKKKSSPSGWILSDNNPSDEITEVCQQLFGKPDGPGVQMEKIHSVQRQLLAEAKSRNAPEVQKSHQQCEQGRLYFMVDNPCKQGCPDDKPYLDPSTGSCGDQQSEGSLVCDKETMQGMKLPDLSLYVQCIDGVDAASPVFSTEIQRSGGKVKAGGSAKAGGRAKAGGKTKSSSGGAKSRRREQPEYDEEPPQPRRRTQPQPYHSKLMCGGCQGGMEGPTINPATGACAPYDINGVAPQGFVACKPVPCPDVRAPCYKVASDYDHPHCSPKDPLSCRQTDPTGVQCTAHACPAGHIENTAVQWQSSFYQDPIDRTNGLWRQQLSVDEISSMEQALPGAQDGSSPGAGVGAWGSWQRTQALT